MVKPPLVFLYFSILAANHRRAVFFQGRIFDSHSVILSDGSRECWESRDCYRVAYLVTLGASVASVLISLWSIRYHNVKKFKASKTDRDLDVSREA